MSSIDHCDLILNDMMDRKKMLNVVKIFLDRDVYTEFMRSILYEECIISPELREFIRYNPRTTEFLYGKSIVLSGYKLSKKNQSNSNQEYKIPLIRKSI